MAKVLLKRYVHASKESNYDLEAEFGRSNLLYVNYEVEVLIEIDTETGEHRLVGCDGKFLGDESYESEEFYEMQND